MNRKVTAALLGAAIWFGAVLAILTWYAWRQDVHDRLQSSCVSNMRLINHCKEVVAIKKKLPKGHVIGNTPETIWAQLDPYADGTNLLQCPLLPRGTHYIYGPIGTAPQCPYGGNHVYVTAGD